MAKLFGNRGTDCCSESNQSGRWSKRSLSGGRKFFPSSSSSKRRKNQVRDVEVPHKNNNNNSAKASQRGGQLWRYSSDKSLDNPSMEYGSILLNSTVDSAEQQEDSRKYSDNNSNNARPPRAADGRPLLRRLQSEDSGSATNRSFKMSSFRNLMSNKNLNDSFSNNNNNHLSAQAIGSNLFWAIFGGSKVEEPKEDLRKRLRPTPSAQALLEAMAEENPINIFFLARTRAFYNVCEWAFDLMDTDKSGDIDENELYTGLLLIHLKLGSYVGPAACRFITRKEAHDVFRKFDINRNGVLEKEEFRKVMMVLFSKVLLRVTVQFILTLLIVPMITKFCLEIILWCNYHLWKMMMSWMYTCFLSSSTIHALVQLVHALLGMERGQVIYLEDATFIDWNITSHPSELRTFVYKVTQVLYSLTPESFLKSLPLTFVSAVLGMMIVPNILMSVENYIEQRAAKKQDSLTKKRSHARRIVGRSTRR